VIVPSDPHEPITGAHWLLLQWDFWNTARLATVFRLALDPDAAAELLEGRPVDPSRLDPAEVARAQEQSLVQLVAPIDLLERAA